jgi:predicted ATPase
MGNFVRSRSHLEEVLALYDPTSHASLIQKVGTHPQAGSLGFLAIVMFSLGYPDQAVALSASAIAEERRSAYLPSLANGLAIHNIFLSLVGDDATLNERADELVAVATEQGFPHLRAVGAIFRGWVNVKRHDVAEGILLLRSGLSSHRATGAETLTPYSLGLLARACKIAGQIEEAMTQLDDAQEIVERTGERWFLAELNRHKGQLLLQQGHAEAAEELYRKALSIAREQEAKLWELRAAASLARLRRDQGRRAEARELLAPVYGWFTEGFDTPDLKEAKALFDELDA